MYMVGSVLINAGQVMIRLSHVTRGRRESISFGTLAEPSTPRTSLGLSSFIYWLFGAGLLGGGATINIVGLNLAAQSLLEALGSVQFVSNLFFSVLILGEKVQRRHLLSTALIVCGNVLIVAWGDHHNQKITRSHLLELVTRTPFIIYMLCVYTGASVLGVLECYVSRKNQGEGGRAAVLLFSLSSASVGANCAMVLKALSGLLHTYLVDSPKDGPKPKPKVIACITVVAILGAAHIIFWLTRLNQGLKRYPALFIVPLLQACWIIFTVTSGGIFFGEFDDMSRTQVIGFASGLAVVVVGIAMLIPLSPPLSPDDDGQDGAANDSRSHSLHIELDEEGEEREAQARQLTEGGWLTQAEFKRVRRLLQREALSRQRERDQGTTEPQPPQVEEVPAPKATTTPNSSPPRTP